MPEVRRLSRASGPWSHGSDDTPALNPGSRVDALLDRRAVQTRWLIALVLMSGAAASLMWGALHAALGTRSRFALAPAIFRRVGAAASRREDRLRADRSEMAANLLRTHVEEIDDQAKTTKTFTHIVAGLEYGPDLPILAANSAVADRPKAASLTTGMQALPPEILTGTSRALDPRPEARAYANVETAQAFAKPPLGEPLNLTTVAKTQATVSNERRVIIAKPGDTLPNILSALGMMAQDIRTIVTLLSPTPWLDPKAFVGGETIVLTSNDPAGGSYRPLKVSVQHPGRAARDVALADNGRYVLVAAQPDEPGLRSSDIAEKGPPVLRGSGDRSLRESLEALARSRRIEPALIDELMRLCVHDADPDARVSRDDAIELLYGANESGDPELVFAALTLGGHTHRYYRFTPPDGDASDYYNADGQAVTQFLLRKPVAAGRLGDGFGWRIHPILMDHRFHRGVDYAAPFGSPIVAAGDGVVEKIDQQWGYGKYVRIRHDLGYETTYAHISGVPRGLQVGARVHQGQTIAYVGSTGLSTGPHLYYELRINGRDVDPLRVHLRAGRILEGEALEAFEASRRHIDVLRRASSAPNEAHP